MNIDMTGNIPWNISDTDRLMNVGALVRRAPEEGERPNERRGGGCMNMITAVDRLFEAHLIVASLETSIAFYRDRLGFTLAHVELGRQAAFFWIGSRGHTMLGLWGAGAGPQKTTTHIAFAAALDDVLAAPLRLQSAGITALDFDGEPADEPVVLAWMPAASIYFRDPDGHLLEYIAMLDEAPRPQDGVVAWRQWTRTPRPHAPARNTFVTRGYL
jgi:lactoylglutathione lyase